MVILAGKAAFPIAISTAVTGSPSSPSGSWIKIASTTFTVTISDGSQKLVNQGGFVQFLKTGKGDTRIQVRGFVQAAVQATFIAEYNAINAFINDWRATASDNRYLIIEDGGVNVNCRDNLGVDRDYFLVKLGNCTVTAKAGGESLSIDISMERSG